MRTRYVISIGYTDGKGVKRYSGDLGNLWLDLESGRGQIELPPGVAITGGGGPGVYVNVGLPRERDGGAPRQQQQQGRGEPGKGGDDIAF